MLWNFDIICLYVRTYVYTNIYRSLIFVKGILSLKMFLFLIRFCCKHLFIYCQNFGTFISWKIFLSNRDLLIMKLLKNITLFYRPYRTCLRLAVSFKTHLKNTFNFWDGNAKSDQTFYIMITKCL